MDAVKRDLHTTTAHVSSLLTRYSRLAQQTSTNYSSSGLVNDDIAQRKTELETEIEGSLETFTAQIERLANFYATAHPPPSATQTHALERHREVLIEYRKDFARTKTNLRDAEQRANLLGSVREEIRRVAYLDDLDAFKTSTNSSVTDRLLQERGHIDNSHRMADDTLNWALARSQAYATRQEFAAQRSGLTGIQARMNGVAAQVPMLNSVIGMINTRRTRDSVIMGSVVGVCVLFLLWYLFG
ncbi:BQ2448_6572 [Microbotryum intermedium]|uniref:Golgi SNAP receptor complex member 1 n=1 Tax=Microbotryum intermedium TaxID=269621 RepID=A0A238FK17_9BASI|nr:BQ2448_6572 [Microbotryum intermedium]